MAVTIPTCAVLTAGGTAIQDYVTTLYTWWASNLGNFTFSNITDSPVTSWTATHTVGWQLNFRVSGSTLLCMVAPNAGIANSSAPVSANSTEVIALPNPSATATRCYVALYDDAIFFSNTHNKS